MDHEAMDYQTMDHSTLEDLQLTKSLDELQITEKPMAEEMKSFYEIMPSELCREFFSLTGLPYTAEEYDAFEQREDDIFYMVLPKSVKEYEEYCEDVIDTRFDILLILECPAVMLIHIMGDKLKRRYKEQWQAIEDIRVRYLKSMFALYKKWYGL